MSKICSKCGLPEELCTCGVREREDQKISVFLETRRFGKKITVVGGIDDNGKEVAKKLKSKLACGGTFKGGKIELQGDHRGRIMDVLVKMGFDKSMIDIM